MSIFLDAPFDVTIPRYAARDGAPPDVHAPENRRYVQGQELYFRECDPRSAATIVVRHDSLSSPEIVRDGLRDL